MRRWIFALAALAAVSAPAQAKQAPAKFDWFEYRGDDHLPKPGPGQYANPILQGFYPDPSIVRVGADYYLVNSTFAWFPGIPVFHSRDLVNWTQIGNAIDRSGQLNFDKMTTGLGVYAPDISSHDGMFYILNTCTACGGNFIISARNPSGPWSDPIWLPDVPGIDTSLFFDEDGSAWIVHNGPPEGKPRYEGHTAIWLQKVDPKSFKSIGKPQVLIDAGVHPEKNPIWIEGPHIFKKDGSYYLIAAEGGTAEDHSEVVFRSEKVTGPYVPGPVNPILTQRDLPKERTNPITSTGHASFVKTQNGDWWAVFLGVRPYDATGNFNTGRETFMMPVHWQGGWPLISGAGETLPWVAARPRLPRGSKSDVPTNGAFTVRDEFANAKLPLYWMMLRNPKGKWWRIADGSLQIEPKDEAFAERGNPSLLARRQQHLNAIATTKVSFDPDAHSEAGLIAMQSDDSWYFIGVGSEGAKRVVRLRRRAGEHDPADGAILASAPVPRNGPLELRIEAHGGSYDFAWSSDGRHWSRLMDGADGTILSTKKAGGFVGSVFGLYAHR